MVVGSITKEFPLATVDATLNAIRPDMTYSELRDYAARHTHRDLPAILRNRFILVDENERIAYDLFLSLAHQEGLDSPRIRKIMYFVFAMRDDRIRRFVTERIAGPRGHWRPAEIVRKANAAFFEGFLKADPATKARSNFERFLVEAGIFDPATRSVHLELDDGWLVDAVRVTAQHEPVVERRRAMVKEPIQFLIRQRLNALANATVQELEALSAATALIDEEDPLEDDILESGQPATDRSKSWDRKKPKPTDRSTGSVALNLVARERASTAHWELEELLANAVRSKGLTPLYNANIDMYFVTPRGMVLAEIKSCHRRNLHSQIRSAVSQLFEYRYLYRESLGEKVVPLLVLETRPSGKKEWMNEYLDVLGLVVAWRQEDRLVSQQTIPGALAGIIEAPSD